MRALLTILLSSFYAFFACAEMPRAFPEGQRPNDKRLGALRNLNDYFPCKPVSKVSQWPNRRAEIKRRILVSQGLWPMPTKSDLNAVIHGRVERDRYVVDRVFFESIPGHFVTGSLYRPKGTGGPFPAVLSPHGHWKEGRFYDAGEAHIRADLQSGAEQFIVGGRFPIQARAVQLARMGCIVFVYDMTGNADSIQIGHRPDEWSELDNKTDWGFFSAQAELRLQNMMGLQTWNSIRAIDFLMELDDVDTTRIGVTGASGGGTQSMIIGAIDDRVSAAMPCVMVSTSMQGGCTCENAPYLRIGQGNVDIAAAIAPRPLGLTAADDWTVELETKGYPALRQLYSDLGHSDRLTAAFNVQFKHNYNAVNRQVMYEFFNRHFGLGLKKPILEGDYKPLSKQEATVWTDDYPRPSGNAVGPKHEVRILRLATRDSELQVGKYVREAKDDYKEFRRVIGGAWETIIGRRLDQVREVKFTLAKKTKSQRTWISVGSLDHDGEQLPMTKIDGSKTVDKPTVIWISDRGKMGFGDGETLNSVVSDLADAGHQIISADLFGQGEFNEDGRPSQAQRMWYQRDATQGWQRFSGYTYGYNHPLFVKRVHDVLSLIKYAQSNSKSKVHLVGIGKQAGPIVAAARSQAGDAVERTFVDTKGFLFETLTKQDDPMFVPGAVKYLDVDGLLCLCQPGHLEIVGSKRPVVQKVNVSTDSSNVVRWHNDTESLLSSIQYHNLRAGDAID